ncbi:GAF domain-containing protein [Nitrincola tapanii]|nr:GAF domain-containing protein [Nitrincola tapanii]
MNRGFLADCEKEPLQSSGKIQSYGALLILSSTQQLLHVSANFTELTALSASEVADLVRAHKLFPAIKQMDASPGARFYAVSGLETEQGVWDLIVSRGPELEYVIEFLPAEVSRLLPAWVNPPLIETIQDHVQLDHLRKELIAWVAQVSGYERVMYYQFLEGGDGEVVAETCSSEALGSYLGLRFPASDIPQIARNIYVKNPWRVIADAASSPVAVQGEGQADLTWCDLRSVSPIHAVYMQNMGDRASLSLPVVSGAELDALISCHSPLAGSLPLQRILAIHEVTRRFNMLLRDFRSRTRVRLVDEITLSIQAALKRQALAADQAWADLSAWLMQEFDADAVIWCRNHQILAAGLEVEPELLKALDDGFNGQSQELVFLEDRLRNRLSSELLSSFSGAAGLRFRREGDDGISRVYFLRIEQVEEVFWGGNPDKPVEYHDGVLGIAPRRSFAKWVEKKLGYCRPWGSATRLKLLRLRDELQKFKQTLPADPLPGGHKNAG